MPSYLVLARKYRPATFFDVIGQDHVVQTLRNSIVSGRVAHAFLLCGVRGVGKTTVARILAKALNCTGRGPEQADPCDACPSCREIAAGISVDVQEIDGASNTSVDNIREINENIRYPPVSSPFKIIIIDEVHMISINAFNALLKTLEEPPAHAKFIFATTESHKVPSTINSRCQRFNFRTISVKELSGGMARILDSEGIGVTEEALALVAREAQGSFRDGLSLLDQVIAFGSGQITAQTVIGILGIAGREAFGRLVRAALRRDPAAALSLLHELFQEGYDPEQFVLDMIQYIRNLIVAKTVPRDARKEGLIDSPPSEVEELDELAGEASAEELHNLFGMLTRSEGEIKRSGNPWVSLEMLILRMCFAPEIVTLSEVLRRLDSGEVPAPREPSRAVSPKWRPPEPQSLAPAAKPRPTGSASVPPPAPPAPPPTQSVPPPPPALPTAPAPVPENKPTVRSERFVITEMKPVPTGTPDEVWSDFKKRIDLLDSASQIQSVVEHGDLISFGPTELEIGFTRGWYKEQFESLLQTKEELTDLFSEVFGDARIKTLVLAEQTSLTTPKPYAEPEDGQTDLHRALKNEALEHPITRAVQTVFEDSAIEEIRILASPDRATGPRKGGHKVTAEE